MSDQELNTIAPCGINCRLCYAYQRDKKPCPGCRGDDSQKPGYCTTCQMRGCEKHANAAFDYCFVCDTFPCARLKQLDKRYRTKYGTSPVDNLLNIKQHGIAWFVEQEAKKWVCPQCGAQLCMHRPLCPVCGTQWNTSVVRLDSIDDYIRQFPEEVQKKLLELRRVIKGAAPDAAEKISYKMPTFFLQGNLVHFAAFQNHIGFYPTPSGIQAFASEFSAYESSKGAVRFPIDQPLPLDLVERVVRFRLAENLEKAAQKSARKKKGSV